MDISKIEKWSPSSNVYDDLRAMDSLSCPKVPTRSTSTIDYISPRKIENSQVKRSTVSFISPTSTAVNVSNEQITTTLETILSIDDTKQSTSIELIEQESKDLVTNNDCNFVFKEKDQSCICWTIRQIVQLICIALFACFIAVFVFTLIFYAFDVYWLNQHIGNHSFWWFDTNFTEFDYDMISTTKTIDYDDEY